MDLKSKEETGIKRLETSLLVVISLIAISISIFGCQSAPSVENIEQVILKSSREGLGDLPRGIEEIEVIKIGKKDKWIIGASPSAFPSEQGGHEETAWLVKVRLKGTWGKTQYNKIKACVVFKEKGEWKAMIVPKSMLEYMN